MKNPVLELHSSSVLSVWKEVMREMQLHITVKCMPLSRRITKSTRITEMVIPIERVAGVDVADEAEAVEMGEEEDMLIIKMSNLLHRYNLLHRLNLQHSRLIICGITKPHLQCLPHHIMIKYLQGIPSIALAIPLSPFLYLGLERRASILVPGHISLLEVVVLLPKLPSSST